MNQRAAVAVTCVALVQVASDGVSLDDNISPGMSFRRKCHVSVLDVDHKSVPATVFESHEPRSLKVMNQERCKSAPE